MICGGASSGLARLAPLYRALGACQGWPLATCVALDWSPGSGMLWGRASSLVASVRSGLVPPVRQFTVDFPPLVWYVGYISRGKERRKQAQGHASARSAGAGRAPSPFEHLVAQARSEGRKRGYSTKCNYFC